MELSLTDNEGIVLFFHVLPSPTENKLHEILRHTTWFRTATAKAKEFVMYRY
jgi:hypothetical protein